MSSAARSMPGGGGLRRCRPRHCRGRRQFVIWPGPRPGVRCRANPITKRRERFWSPCSRAAKPGRGCSTCRRCSVRRAPRSQRTTSTPPPKRSTPRQRILAASTDFRAARLKSEVLALKASLAWSGRDLAGAERAMEEALAGMGPERSARRAAALLERARIRADAGADLEAAQRDLDEATVLLRSRGLEGAQPLPSEETRAAFDAAATLVSARSDLQGPRGLAISENLRLLLTGVMPGAPVGHPLQSRERRGLAFKRNRCRRLSLWNEGSARVDAFGRHDPLPPAADRADRRRASRLRARRAARAHAAARRGVARRARRAVRPAAGRGPRHSHRD